MIDPTTDMLNRIRNAQAVLKPTVSLPFSDFKYKIAKILEEKGYIEKVEEKGKKIKRTLEINLKYNGKTPVISAIKKVSKPGQRIYTQAKDIKAVKTGYGIAVISTSRGLMTNKEAKKRKLGGEIIFEIW